jgi:DNA-directed RNA polymerase I, II, and III subunit RPABC2
MSDIESEYSEGAESGSSDDEGVPTTQKKKITKKVIRNPNDSDGSQVDSDEESQAETVDESYASSDLESEVDEDELYEDALETKKKTATKKKDSDIPEYVFDIGDEDSSDEEDEDYGTNYLQKLDEEMKRDVILDYHPELVQHNYEEVESLSTIVYDELGVINDPLHQTLPFLTKYEKARILGERAKQINGGAKPFVDLGPEIIDGFIIASAELEQKKIPFIIRRPLMNGGCEYWKLKDLEQL